MNELWLSPGGQGIHFAVCPNLCPSLSVSASRSALLTHVWSPRHLVRHTYCSPDQPGDIGRIPWTWDRHSQHMYAPVVFHRPVFIRLTVSSKRVKEVGEGWFFCFMERELKERLVFFWHVTCRHWWEAGCWPGGANQPAGNGNPYISACKHLFKAYFA